jgi:hypothetical protein
MEEYDIIFRRFNFANKDIMESLRIAMKSFKYTYDNNEKKETRIDEYIREFSKAFIRDNFGDKEFENEEIFMIYQFLLCC